MSNSNEKKMEVALSPKTLLEAGQTTPVSSESYPRQVRRTLKRPEPTKPDVPLETDEPSATIHEK